MASVGRDYFELNYKKVDHPGFIMYLGGIADAVEVHPGYQNLPAPVPNPAKFRDLANRLTLAVKAAQYGDSQKKIERDAIRAEGEDASLALANWAVILYLENKDPSFLANIGIAPKKPVVRNNQEASDTAPQDVKVGYGKLSGWAVVKAARVVGYASLEVQCCQGIPTSEESWGVGEHFPHCSHMEVKGLEPGKTYYFRVRYLGNNGHGPWSAVVSIMMI